MDPKFSKEAAKKQEYYQDPEHFHMYTNETRISKDTRKKKIRYQKGPATDDDFPINSAFQIPEKDKTRYNLSPEESFNKSSKYLNKQPNRQGKLKDSSKSRNHDPTLQYDQDVNYTSKGQKFDRNVSPQNDFENSRSLRSQSIDRERVTNQINYAPPSAYTNYKGLGRAMSEKPGSEINTNPSLICRALNHDGEPVVVNDEVIRDKLILSCRPRSHYGPAVYLNKTNEVDSGRVPKYIYPPPDVSVVENVNIKNTTDIDIHQQRRLVDQSYEGMQKNSLVKSDTHDLGNLGVGDQGLQNDKDEEIKKYEEQFRIMQCKRYRKTFKKFLWALFTINLLLLLVGITVMLIALRHLLFYSYINTVIAHKGYTMWVWAVLGLSPLIILVAVYGMATALTRVKRMLQIYCVLALALAIVILIFLLLFWLTSKSQEERVPKDMKSTKDVYRCDLSYTHVAWNSLQESFECCGIDGRGDWNYIPPSCCHAENKYQKKKCIAHFINEDQAYKSGCRGKVISHFATMFLLLTCLLILAIILLLLGILVALRLLKMYKIIRACREMYLITP